MSQKSKGGKRSLSHDQVDELSNPKRGRATLSTNSLGGTTLREKSPLRFKRAHAQPINAFAATMPRQGDGSVSGSGSGSGFRSQLQDELNRLTIKEKLQKGIVMSFVRERKYGNDIIKGLENNRWIPCNELQYLRRRFFTVKGMQKIAELASHVDAYIDPLLLEDHSTATPGYHDGSGIQQTFNIPLWALGTRTPQITRPYRNQHLHSMHIIALRESNKRLQAITGMINSNQFTPFHLGFKVRSAGEPHATIPLPEGTRSLSPPENLLDFLERAARKNGYRKLELDSLVFRELQQLHMRDLNSIEIPPIGAMSERRPIELDKAEILMSLDTKKGSITLYQTNLKDGTPSFWNSSKPRVFKERSLPDNFLWLDQVGSFVGDPELWWKTLEFRAGVDQWRWSRIIEAMAEFNCLVEVKSKPGVGWVNVLAETEGRQGAQFDQAQGLSEGSGRGKGQRSGKITLSGSGLRYEVHNY